ncbi:MAG: DUF6089 family protein [Reichenbachiella sp.]
MRKNIIISLVLAFVVLCASDVTAQRKNQYGHKKSKSSKKYSKYKGGKVGYSGVGNPKYATIGISANFGSYMGDLTPGNGKFSTDYAGSFVPKGVGITASKVIYPGIFMRGGFNWVRLEGSDYQDSGNINETDPSEAGRYIRNFHFRNDILELSAGLEIDMIPSNGGARRRFPVNPYLYLGIAGFYNNPKAIAPEFDQAGNETGQAGEWVALQPLQTSDKDYSKIQLSLPVGLGVKLKVTKSLDVNIEFGLRYTFTDFLDDVGGNYRDFDEFGDNALARAMSERGGEQYGYLSGEEKLRDTNIYVPANGSLPVTGPYTHGLEYIPGQPKAGSEGVNDFYVVTQIRLVYILDKRGASRGKFR